METSPGSKSPPGEGRPGEEGEESAILEGAMVQRVDAGPSAAVLDVRVPGRSWLVVVASLPGPRVGVLASTSRAEARAAASAGASGLRKRLEGARVAGLFDNEVHVERGGARLRLSAGSAEVRLEEVPEGDPEPPAAPHDLEAWMARGSAILARLGPAVLERARQAALSALAKERRRMERRTEAIREDLARGDEARAKAEDARWFVAAAATAPRGARELRVDGGESEKVLPLDPAKGAKEQLEAIFTKARRMQKGLSVARARLAEAESAVVALDARREAALRATSLADLGMPAGGRGEPARSGARSKKPATRLPYRAFLSPSGAVVYVGRGAADNDALTLKVARPHDLWLHAHGSSGAHVVVPLDKGKEITPDALVDAAHLAAHFSGQRSERHVEIHYAPRGRVRKPKGSPPGLVVVDHPKSLALRVEPERLARLLATETK